MVASRRGCGLSSAMMVVPYTVVVGIPCLLRGGTEMQTLSLAKALSARTETFKAEGGKQRQECDYRVTVVCYFECDSEVVEEFQTAGADVRLLNLDRSTPAWRFVNNLRREFRRLKPDVVHIQYMAPGFLAVLAARLAGCRRVLATVHQPWTSNHHGPKARRLLRAAARLCTRFVCVSEAAEKSWFGDSARYPLVDAISKPSETSDFSFPTSHFPRRHFTIHNAIDTNRIDTVLAGRSSAELRRQLECENVLVIGTVARLSYEKGVDILIAAFAQLMKRVPSARLLIVGDGDQRATLEAQAAALGLSQGQLQFSPLGLQVSASGVVALAPVPPRLLWAGRQPWGRVIELFQEMDIVVVSSRFEGFGLTAGEAMACGKPVVASEVEALREVVGSDRLAGMLFPVGDSTGLAEALFALAALSSRRLELGRNARRRVEECFSFKQYRQRTQTLYAELLAK